MKEERLIWVYFDFGDILPPLSEGKNLGLFAVVNKTLWLNNHQSSWSPISFSHGLTIVVYILITLKTITRTKRCELIIECLLVSSII